MGVIGLGSGWVSCEEEKFRSKRDGADSEHQVESKAYSESSPSSLIDEPIDKDVEYESISFSALEES